MIRIIRTLLTRCRFRIMMSMRWIIWQLIHRLRNRGEPEEIVIKWKGRKILEILAIPTTMKLKQEKVIRSLRIVQAIEKKDSDYSKI